MRKLEFDTRNKKPALYNLLLVTGIVFFVVGWLLLDGKTNAAAVSVILECYFVVVLVLLMSAFVKQLQYNPYSYNTIYYIGFSLFLLSVLIAQIISAARAWNTPGDQAVYNAFFILSSGLFRFNRMRTMSAMRTVL